MHLSIMENLITITHAFNKTETDYNTCTVKPANTVTSIKLSHALKGQLFLLLLIDNFI
jgi:hypothetical protein